MAGDALNRSPYTDGFRTPTPPVQPRRAFTGEQTPDKYGRFTEQRFTPSHDARLDAPPRNFRFFRTLDHKAARVGLPDAARTAGRLQRSGRAFGSSVTAAAKPLGSPILRTDVRTYVRRNIDEGYGIGRGTPTRGVWADHRRL